MATPEMPESTHTIPAGAFTQMGWAFLFIGLTLGPSIRLGQESFTIDLLPDFIGYLLIATAANRLLPLCRQARGVRNLAMLLTFLSVPATIQYTAVASQSNSITTWTAPLWPFSTAVGLLELVLVWQLCGLVADLARRAGDGETERRAYSRRLLYIGLKLLVIAGIAAALVSPKPELIIGAAIGALVIGLIVLGMMIGLMRRAERLGPVADETAEQPRPSGWGFRLLVASAIILPIFAGIGAICYYIAWDEARRIEDQKASNSNYFSPPLDAFYADLLAGRIDDAYEATTRDFKTRISRNRLAELAGKYADYAKKRDQGGGASGAGVTSGHDHLARREYREVEKGKIVQVEITVRRDRDSLFYWTPPPVRVDDFNVEEKQVPDRQWPGFGRPPGR